MHSHHTDEGWGLICASVLILVVMEDALAHVQRYATRNLKVQS